MTTFTHTIALLNAMCAITSKMVFQELYSVMNYTTCILTIFNQADMIYVNYGRAEDFEYLLKRNVSCRGKIVIVRYGGNFRGDKVNRCAC